MIISCNLLFICDNYLDSALKSSIDYHLFLSRRMLHAEVMDQLFICDNLLYSALWSSINYHLFLSQRMLNAAVTDHEQSFAHKMGLQALL